MRGPGKRSRRSPPDSDRGRHRARRRGDRSGEHLRRDGRGGRPGRRQAGARGCERGDYCLDAEATAEAVGPATRFVVPVHLYGQMADMETISSMAARTASGRRGRLPGARRRARRLPCGRGRPRGAFSFYPAKNLGAFGDAGAVVTDDEELASMLRALREHGEREVPSRVRGLHGAARCPPGTRASPQAPASRGVEPSGAMRPAVRRRAAGSRRSPPAAERRERARMASLLVRTAVRMHSGTTSKRRGIQTGRHYPEPSTSRRRTRGSARRGRVPGRRSDRSEASRCRSSPGSPPSRSSTSSTRSRTTSSTWLTSRRTTLLSIDADVEFGEG